MIVTVEWDRVREIAEVRYQDVCLDSELSIAQWREQLVSQLQLLKNQNGGERFWILVCLNGVDIVPAFGAAYGLIVKDVMTEYALGVARYGNRQVVRQIVALEGMRLGFRANLFDTHEEARRFIQNARETAPNR